MKKAWSQARVLARTLMRQGMAPRELALCFALGATVCVCPILGVATPLLTVLALSLRLNLPLIQLINYLGTPVQWALIIPFIRLGEWLCRQPPLPLAPSVILDHLRDDPGAFMREFSMAAVCAVAGWLFVGIPLLLLTFLLVRALATRHARALAAPHAREN